MVETLRELGRVKLTQVQPAGLIIETSSGSTYDPSRRGFLLVLSDGQVSAEVQPGDRVVVLGAG
jgi:hypothetical protein